MKIANKITVAFIIVAMAMGAIGSAALLILVEDELRELVVGNLKADLWSRATHIETYLDMLKSSTNQLSRSVVLENLLKSPREVEALKMAVKRLKRTEEVNASVYEFMLMDKDGIVIASSDDKNIGLDQSGTSYFLAGRDSFSIKEIYSPDTARRVTLVASAPIIDSTGGSFLGVLAAKVGPDDLFKIVTDRTGLGRSGEVYIVNKYGYMITPSRFMKDGAFANRLETESFRKSQMAHERGFAIGPAEVCLGYRGALVLETHSHIGRMGWMLFADIDVWEAAKPLIDTLYAYLLVLLLVPVISWPIARYMSGLIIKPILKLQEGARIIGSGHLEYKVSTDSDDEIGQLSRAFDDMTKDLRKKSVSVDILNEEVAERERAQALLQRLSAIVESSEDAIIGKDLGGVVTSWNKGAERVLGYLSDEIIGKSVSVMIPDDKREEETVLLDSIRNGKAIQRYETRRIRKDGKAIDVSLTLSPIRNSAGHVIGASSIIRDITESKIAEAAIKASENKVRAVLDQTYAFIGMMTTDGTLVEANKAALDFSGIDMSSVMGKPFWDGPWWAHSEELRVKLKDAVKRAAAGEFIRFEATHPTKTGTLHYIDFSLKPVRDESGKVVFLIPEGRDITARKKAEEVLKEAYDDLKKAQTELIQAEKMVALGRFSYGAAHEIKNPLGIILGGTEYLEAKYKDADEDTKETLQTVVAAVKRADRIIDALVRFSEAKRSNVKIIGLQELVDGAMKMVGQDKSASGIKFKFEYSSESLRAEVEAERMHYALYEILENAIEAMPGGGQITIRTYKEATREFLEDVIHSVIEISDSGEGIPKESLPKVFEPFFTTKRDKKQIGLGLPVARAIVNINKGEIFIDSELGKGTVVKVALPLA